MAAGKQRPREALPAADTRPGTLLRLYGRRYRVTENRVAAGVRRTRLLWGFNLGSLGLAALAFAAGLFLLLSFHESIGLDLLSAAALLPLSVILIVAHELFHLLGYRLIGGVPRARVRLGFHAKALVAYAVCLEPVSVRATRHTLLLPLWVCGLLPLAAGVAAGSLVLVTAGAVLTGGSVADLWYLWDLRRTPGTALVMECMPDQKGYAMGMLVMERSEVAEQETEECGGNP